MLFIPEAETVNAGTVIVLTTPDANRTFLSYLGTPQAVQLDSAVTDAICSSRIVAVEGYIWETPSAADQIQKVISLVGLLLHRDLEMVE